MKLFEVGKTYFCRSACDYECVWAFQVIARTPATITISGEDGVKTLRINKKEAERFGCEYARPFGRYSMCPTIAADQHY